MTVRWTTPFSFEGRIDRARYFIIGVFLVALKYFVDWSIAARFHRPWSAWNYFVPPSDVSMFTLAGPLRTFYLTLWLVAIPFFWIGVTLTIKRLRDAGYRALWIFLFFVPTLNLVFFLLLSVAPTAPRAERIHVEGLDVDDLPRTHAVPLAGIMLAALIGLGLATLSTNFLGQYSWGLFLGVPFVVGFVASWFYNYGTLHPRMQTAAVCVVATSVIGVLLIGFHQEGLICLLMALPLALPFAIAGGLAAHHSLAGRGVSSPQVTASLALFPLLLFAEHIANFTPPALPVVTSITINAPASTVWRNVIAFPPLAAPHELLFHTGIAYPIGATIYGTGVGAIRRCRFSTGDFVEPITIWDENHLLAFNVIQEPPSMHELGLGEIHAPHIERNYMRSQHGQFRLTAIDANHTLLEGTTWYQDYFWPQLYWRTWSDAIVHRIHTRVLEHIKAVAESQTRHTSQP